MLKDRVTGKESFRALTTFQTPLRRRPSHPIPSHPPRRQATGPLDPGPAAADRGGGHRHRVYGDGGTVPRAVLHPRVHGTQLHPDLAIGVDCHLWKHPSVSIAGTTPDPVNTEGVESFLYPLFFNQSPFSHVRREVQSFGMMSSL